MTVSAVMIEKTLKQNPICVSLITAALRRDPASRGAEVISRNHGNKALNTGARANNTLHT